MRRAVVAVVTGLFTLQVAGALALYIHEQSRDMPAALRVLGSATPFPGDTGALRIGVYDRHSSRLLPMHGVEVTVHAGGDATAARVVAPRDGQSMAVATYVVPDSDEARADIHVVAPVVGERDVTAELRPGSAGRWMLDDDVLGGEGTPRAANRSQGGEAPGVSMRRSDDTCPWRWHVVAAGGVVPRELPGSVLIRLTHADGAPAARVPLEVSVVDDEAPAQRFVTDAAGTALVAADVLWPQTWNVSFECDGSEVTRSARIVPSWDGLQLRPLALSVHGRRSLTVDVDQQRQRGDWHLDVTCDGRLVHTDTLAVRPGTSRIDVPIPARAGADAPVRLCALAAYLYPMAPDPPRSVRAFAVRDEGIDDAAALQAVLRALDERGTDETRAVIADVLIDAVPGLDPQTRGTLWTWAMSSVPVPYRPTPVLRDDLTERLEAFRAEQSLKRRRLLVLLGLDAILVVLTLGVIVIPAMIRQRRALLAALAEGDDDAPDARAVAAPAVVMAAFGVAVVCVSLVGLALLLYYLQ